MHMVDRLKGKVAIVTGGGSGIGRAIATLFAREGAAVAICGRTRAKLDETVRAIATEGGQALAWTCDVSEEEQVAGFVGQVVERFGRLDILVNNAGVGSPANTVLDLTAQEWQRVFDTDAKGPWLCSRYAIPHMQRAGGGSIVMISSISAHLGQPQHGAYNAAKGAQELLMKCMALDFAGDHIRVNSICPGWVVTEMNRARMTKMAADPTLAYKGQTYGDLLKLHPLGRIGAPEDIAWAAVYLASDESAWVTGSSLVVDGGYMCQ
jgi:NAD(P)-dependent dehydrogenase (short-subunit alcohol dehydrogenase family)